MPDTLLGAGTCISKLQNFCNLSNQTSISAIWLQSSCIAVWLFRLQFDCGDCSLTPCGGLGHVYVSCGTFAISAIRLQSQQSDCNLSNQNKTPSNMPDTLFSTGAPISKLRNFCNLSNQTAITAIRLQSQQLDCNLSNQTEISAICLQSFWIAVRLHRLIWIAKQNCNQIAISTIRLQSPQSECRHDATSLSTPGTNNCICKLRNFF